ncbi:bZIP transcription factor [Spirosoma litoris]
MKQLSTLLLTTGFITISSHLTFAQIDQNTVLGYQAGNSTMTGQGNTYMGYQTGVLTNTGNSNVFIGSQAGHSNTSGSANTFIGNQAGINNTTATGNLFLGNQAGSNNSTGSYNLFMGNSSGNATTTGGANTAIGDGAFLSNTTGTNSVSIGRYAGINMTTGSNNTFIGVAATAPSGSGAITNATAIGYNASVTASNALVLGNGVNVGIGNTAPTNKLHVTTGTANTSGLRLENLTSSSPASVLSQTKFLTVDGSGNVVLGSTPGSARLGAELWSTSGDNLQSTNSGGVVIGAGITQTPVGYKLFVEQGILTEKVKVAVKSSADWSDYVFAPGYKLASLAEVALHIQQKGHLPGIPSAKEMVEKGNDLHQTDAKLLEKIEELTLYLIQQKRELDTLRQQNQQIKEELEVLKKTNH